MIGIAGGEDGPLLSKYSLKSVSYWMHLISRVNLVYMTVTAFMGSEEWWIKLHAINSLGVIVLFLLVVVVAF